MREFIDVEWLTEISMFKNHIRLVAGKGGLARHVTYVTVQEAPDFYKQIEGGEFVLSTWYAFKDDMDAGLDAIRNLCGIASGVCIKVNRFIDKLPPEYLKCADEFNLPLFIVDKSVKFREIIKSITLEINMAHVNVLVQLNDYYTYLFQTALENGSADSMLLDFARRSGLIAITVSADFKQLRGMRSFQKLPDHEYRLQVIKDIISLNSSPVKYFCENEYHIFPCIARGYCYGYLVVLSANMLSERQRLYIAQLVNIITIKWLDRQEKENDTLLSLLDMILNSPERDQERIIQFLNKKSIDYTSGIRAIQIKYDKPNKSDTKVNFAVVQRFLADMIAIKPNLLYIWDKPADSFTLLIDKQTREGDDLSHGFLHSVAKISENYRDISVSIGPVVTAVSDIRVSIKMAKNSFLFKSGDESNVICYKENLMQFALLGGADSRESDFFLEYTIIPLIEHDRCHDDLIMETLSCVVENATLEQAAKKQNIHVNSVRYRLQKIKNICGLDFFNQNEKYIMIIAYMIYKNRKKYCY
ncbi:PucR family transcriptional regulator [Synergistes jonesii]|uniref:PucR family transcriptional regulator n=1 Tax=Synergistes jonesii TaxID=2754 RepID=UPI003330406B